MKNSEKKLYMLEEGSISAELFKLGIPTMIGMMTSSLYNLIDTYFVGKLGTAEMSAVSIVYPISIITLGIGLLFGSGASSYLARLLGDKKNEEASECASTALFTCLLFAGVIIGIMLLFLQPILEILGATPTIMPYAKQYAIYFIIGLIFNVFNITVNNIITSEGASFYSMVAMLIGSGINIVLDPVLIFGFNMGVQGAAVSSLVSRIISSILYLIYILSGKSNLHFSLKRCRPNIKVYIEIFKIGIPMLIYQLLCSLALVLTNSRASKYGDSAIAALGVVSRILSLCTTVIMGFLKGYQPFVGFNFGAGKYDRVKKATKTSLIWTSIYAACIAAILILGRTQIMHSFSKSNSDVILLGSKALIFNGITFLGIGFQLVYGIMFMGLGKAKEGGIVSLGRQGIFFIPIIMVCSTFFGLTGIIIAQPLADVCSMILVFFMVRKAKKTGCLYEIYHVDKKDDCL